MFKCVLTDSSCVYAFLFRGWKT